MTAGFAVRISSAPRPDQELIIKAAALARSAPQAWSEFILAMNKFATAGAMLCVASPPDQLQRMQGRAQQCAEITTLFEDAVKSADRITNLTAGSSSTANPRR